MAEPSDWPAELQVCCQAEMQIRGDKHERRKCVRSLIPTSVFKEGARLFKQTVTRTSSREEVIYKLRTGKNPREISHILIWILMQSVLKK